MKTKCYIHLLTAVSGLMTDYLQIAEKCNLDLDEEQRLFYATVTAFNINARYDDYKLSFQKTCTPDFTARWIERIIDKRSVVSD